jgi:hypothetical protein
MGLLLKALDGKTCDAASCGFLLSQIYPGATAKVPHWRLCGRKQDHK